MKGILSCPQELAGRGCIWSDRSVVSDARSQWALPYRLTDRDNWRFQGQRRIE